MLIHKEIEDIVDTNNDFTGAGCYRKYSMKWKNKHWLDALDPKKKKKICNIRIVIFMRDAYVLTRQNWASPS